MKRIIFLLLLLSAMFPIVKGQTTPKAFELFKSKGEKADYQQMISDLTNADVVFIGEYHNNPISHWMELEITQALYQAKNGNIILGAEMFETDCQLILSEYVSGVISTSRFEADCRLWHNYSTDYSPLVEFARENGLPFIATNIPRRYADIVHHRGEAVLDSLSSEAKQLMAPLPIPFKPDSVMTNEMGIMSMMSKNPLGVAKAQAVKDATMAHFIAQNLEKGNVFIHYNGSFHSDSMDGIIYFLKKYAPGIKIATVSTAQQDDVSYLDENYHQIADYIICVPTNMTRTY